MFFLPYRRQYGKATGSLLSGILIGLIVAVAVIAALMAWMNHQKTPFQPPVERKAEPVITQPEQLTPPAVKTESVPAPVVSEVLEDTPDELEKIIEALPGQTEQKTESAPAPKMIENAQVVPAMANAPSQKTDEHTDLKADVTSAHPVSANVMLQAGSFANRDEANRRLQSVTLSLGGVFNIEEVTVNGQKYFRVRSQKISRTQGEKWQNILKNQKIDSFLISAS